MEMIIGGAFQGKLDYGKKQYPHIRWIDGANCSQEDLIQTEGIYNFQEYIRREVEADHAVMHLADMIIEQNPNVCIIADEVGYGVVPIEPKQRQFREETGRICTRLAAFSSKVTRVICGIGKVIKDD